MPKIEDITQRLYELKRELEDIIDEFSEFSSPVPAPAAGPKLAVIVGHTQRSPGAFGEAPINKNEYFWNAELAESMQNHATDLNLTVGVFYRDEGGIAGAYSRAGEWGAQACIELHFNAATVAASGTETIVVTEQSKPFAKAVHAAMVETLNLRDRGVKAPWGARGQKSLTQLEVPSIIVEPFFGTNPGDCECAQEKKEALARSLVKAAASILVA